MNTPEQQNWYEQTEVIQKAEQDPKIRFWADTARLTVELQEKEPNNPAHYINEQIAHEAVNEKLLQDRHEKMRRR